MYRSVTFQSAVVFLLCGASLAQTPASQVTQVLKPTSQGARATPEGWEKEEENRKRMQEELVRKHSDQSGRFRPDLLSEGIAHMKRMKVAGQVGPAPKISSGDKKSKDNK